jgi:ubiquinone/menaquinone biosynthesis C-methylase UbiE
MELLIIILSLLFICLLALSWFAGSDAPYIPTKNEKIHKIIKLADLKKGDNFYELGSGDGRVVLQAAKKGINSYGIEQSWIRTILSRIKAKNLNLTNAHFFHGNIFERQYYPADVVYIYLLPSALDKLEQKLKKELKKEARVVTQKYHFKNWKPIEKDGDFWIYKNS